MFVSAVMQRTTKTFEFEAGATIDCTDNVPSMENMHETLEDCLKGFYFKSYTYRLFEVSLTLDSDGEITSIKVIRAIHVEFVRRGEIRLV